MKFLRIPCLVIFVLLGFISQVLAQQRVAIIYVDHPPSGGSVSTSQSAQITVDNLNIMARNADSGVVYFPVVVESVLQAEQFVLDSGNLRGAYLFGEGAHEVNSSGYRVFLDGIIDVLGVTTGRDDIRSYLFQGVYYCGMFGFEYQITVEYMQYLIAISEGLTPPVSSLNLVGLINLNDEHDTCLIKDVHDLLMDLSQNASYLWALRNGCSHIIASQWALGLISRSEIDRIIDRFYEGLLLN